MTQRREFRLPDVGEGLTEADIVSWRVRPGDSVQINEIIVDIETAKAVVELPCPFEGTVASLLVAEGDTVDVGTPIIAVDSADPGGRPPGSPDRAGGRSPGPTDPAAIAAEGPRPAADDLIPPLPAAADEQPVPAAAAPPREERQAVLVGYGVKLGSATRRPRKAPATGGRSAAGLSGGNDAGPAVNGGGRPATVLAKPPVRKLARDLGVDLAGLAGTGPAGSITRDDVQRAASGPALAAVPDLPSPAGREARIPVRGVRKHTAAAVAASAFTAPHVTEFLQVEVGATMDAVARLRELPELAGVRVSPLLMVARALLIAVQRHPMINSTWDEAAQEIVVKHYVNLGIAAATERGLIVPNIKDAGALSLPGLASALADLADTARAGKSSPADLTGGTITITNVGVFGVDAGTPILTPPEAAILAFGQVRHAPWVVDGELAVGQVTTLSLSFDHRIVDGDLGSAVLRDVGAMLHDPTRMLAWG
ncbi:MAG TPA: dihydrolipoamide acetyltransferase family protein [Streptosporangiaceae bacterium]|nr:dihydrolipoamide acetyltransferase family protein [Streptosporangiaceae bacterium]